MNGEVFESNKFIVFGVIAVLNIGFIVAYFLVDLPIWFILIALPISIIIGISTMKAQLSIENGHLRYETWARGEEVDLMKVAHIARREIETFAGRTTGTDGRGTQKSGISIGNVTLSSGDDQERQVEK